MSSLRITHQSRADAVAGRAEPSVGGASFALALGAVWPKGAAAAIPGSAPGDPAEGPEAQRKQRGSDGKTPDAAATLAAQGMVSPAAVVRTVWASPNRDLAADDLGDADASAVGQAAAPGVTGSAADDPTIATHLPPPATQTATTSLTLDNPSAPADSAAGPAVADLSAMAAGPSLTASLGPVLPAERHSGVVETPPSLFATLPQAQLTMTQAPLDGGNGNDGASRDNGRGRFAPAGAASDSSSGVTPAFVGTGDQPALVSAPSAVSSPVADPTSGSLSNQVADQLVRLVASGSREMLMRLHPPELGELTLRVAVNGRDVSAWFGSAQPQVQAAITASIGQLQVDLGNAGYNLNGAWVGADGSGARQESAGAPAPNPVPIAAASVSQPSAAVSYSPSSAVNIYV